MKINIVLDIFDTPDGRDFQYNEEKIKRWLDSLLEYRENSLVDCDIVSFSKYVEKDNENDWKNNLGSNKIPEDLKDGKEYVEVKLKSGKIISGIADDFDWEFSQYFMDEDIVEYRLS